MQQGCTLEVRLGTTLECVKCGNLVTCIEWSIVDYGTVQEEEDEQTQEEDVEPEGDKPEGDEPEGMNTKR